MREWQQRALALLQASASPDFLAVATPGAGKTTFALYAITRMLRERAARRCVVVVPTQHLKHQWAHAADRFRLHLDPGWSAGYGALPSDVHGVVVTYQQVAANPGALRGLVAQAVVVLDEVHHAGESRAWGDAVRMAFAPATRRLCLSGTPFRSDQNVIPFVRYSGDLAEADFEYGYGDALGDSGVVRPVYFPRIDGHMEWTAPGGGDYAATFADPLTRELANQRLRTALDAEGEWLPAVLEQAHAQLQHLRRRHPSAGGLVIAMDQAHARAIAAIMEERLGTTPSVATSDDPGASEKIGRFADANTPWLVAVRMVSEGVDIPRLRVGVYATNTVTDLFFRQAVGRLVRWTRGLERQTAYMFIPDDPRLRGFGAGIGEQRRHSLRRRNDDTDGIWAPKEGGTNDGEPNGEGVDGALRDPDAEGLLGEDGQLSLFTALSAVPLDEHGRRLEGVRVYEETENESAPADANRTADPIPDWFGDAEVTAPDPLALHPRSLAAAATAVAGPTASPRTGTSGNAPAPLAPSHLDVESTATAPAQPVSPLVRRRQLREQNSEAVIDIAHVTGRSHAEINTELNRRVGIRRISEATVRQLEQRLVAAQKLLRRPT